MGDFLMAEEYQLKCLKIQENNFGENCIQSANTLGNLGLIYKDIEDLKKAKEYLSKCLKI